MLLLSHVAFYLVVLLFHFTCLSFQRPLFADLHIELAPSFSTSGTADAIKISVAYQSDVRPIGTPLFWFYRSVGGVLLHEHEDAIRISDFLGPVDYHLEDDHTEEGDQLRRVITDRQTEGYLTAEYNVLPTRIPSNTTSTPPVDFHAEGKGFVAGAKGITLFPDDEEWFKLALRWNVSTAPMGSRFLSSLGEDDISDELTTNRYLQDETFAGGIMSSYTWSPAFGVYWFTDPPFNITHVAHHTRYLFEYLSAMFQSGTLHTRIILRRNHHHSTSLTSAGSNLRTLILAYTDQFPDPRTPSTITELFTATLASPYLTLTPPELSQPLNETWYTPSLSTYYSLLLPSPSHLHLTSHHHLASRLNRRLHTYYTSPLLHLPTPILATLVAHGDPHAPHTLTTRGLLWLLHLVAHLPSPAHLDRAVAALRLPARPGWDPPRLDDLFAALTPHLPPTFDLRRSFAAMLRGDPPLPDPAVLGAGYTVARVQRERWALGFAPSSLRVGGRVTGLLPGSRAMRAGLREGDEVCGWSARGLVAEEWEARMGVDVWRRDGEREGEGEVERVWWWPRGEKKVECWVFVPEDGMVVEVEEEYGWQEL